MCLWGPIGGENPSLCFTFDPPCAAVEDGMEDVNQIKIDHQYTNTRQLSANWYFLQFETCLMALISKRELPVPLEARRDKSMYTLDRMHRYVK